MFIECFLYDNKLIHFISFHLFHDFVRKVLLCHMHEGSGVRAIKLILVQSCRRGM